MFIFNSSLSIWNNIEKCNQKVNRIQNSLLQYKSFNFTRNLPVTFVRQWPGGRQWQQPWLATDPQLVLALAMHNILHIAPIHRSFIVFMVLFN